MNDQINDLLRLILKIVLLIILVDVILELNQQDVLVINGLKKILYYSQ